MHPNLEEHLLLGRLLHLMLERWTDPKQKTPPLEEIVPWLFSREHLDEQSTERKRNQRKERNKTFREALRSRLKKLGRSNASTQD